MDSSEVKSPSGHLKETNDFFSISKFHRGSFWLFKVAVLNAAEITRFTDQIVLHRGEKRNWKIITKEDYPLLLLPPDSWQQITMWSQRVKEKKRQWDSTQICLMLFQCPMYKAPRSLLTCDYMVGVVGGGDRNKIQSFFPRLLIMYLNFMITDYLYILPLIYIFLKNWLLSFTKNFELYIHGL